jgi:hypothetical protein
MPNVTMTLEEYEALRRLIGSERESEGSEIADRVEKKVKSTRKVSEYQKVFGRNLKALKRKHPRTKTKDLMKKAHKVTRAHMKTIAQDKRDGTHPSQRRKK